MNSNMHLLKIVSITNCKHTAEIISLLNDAELTYDHYINPDNGNQFTEIPFSEIITLVVNLLINNKKVKEKQKEAFKFIFELKDEIINEYGENIVAIHFIGAIEE